MWEFVNIIGDTAFVICFFLGFVWRKYWKYALYIFVPLALASIMRNAAIELSQPGAADRAFASLVIGVSLIVGLVVFGKAVIQYTNPFNWWKKF